MLWNRSHIEKGMTVRSSDGDKLGKIIAMGDESFEIEKGFFILKDYVIPYGDIQDIRDGECFLRYGKEELQTREVGAQDSPVSDTPDQTRATDEGYVPPMSSETRRDHELGRDATSSSGITTGAGGFGPASESEAEGREVTRVPLARERLDVTTQDANAGDVQVHKSVETENETIEVPVRKEKVHVEHVQASGKPATGDAFREETINVPLREEEIQVSKEVVSDEEVQVTKTPVEERKRVSEKVRREHAEVRADDEDIDESKRRGWLPGDDEPTRY